MTRFVVTRFLSSVIVLWLVTVIVFGLTVSLPGDAAVASSGGQASEAEIEAVRHELGLDTPVPLRYLRWLRNVASGDLGNSLSYREPVLDVIKDRIWYTALLALTGWMVGVMLGVTFGTVAAIYRRSVVDRIVMIASVSGHSVPIFWLGLILIQFFSVRLAWFPTGGVRSIDGGGPLDILHHLVLPAATIGLYSSAILARLTRAAMVETFAQEFVRTARSKGLSEQVVVLRHVLRGSIVPVITMAGLQLGYLLGGSILVETVFNWPGLGSTLRTAIAARDLPVISGIILLTSAAFVAINFLVDLLYVVADPRIRVV